MGFAPSPEELLTRPDGAALIRVLHDAFVKYLTPQEQDILRRTFGLGRKPQTCRVIGKALGFSGSYASYVKLRALEKLRRAALHDRALVEMAGPWADSFIEGYSRAAMRAAAERAAERDRRAAERAAERDRRAAERAAGRAERVARMNFQRAAHQQLCGPPRVHSVYRRHWA
jgi:hypothetical protein